jgi:hypothetical protein
VRDAAGAQGGVVEIENPAVVPALHDALGQFGCVQMIETPVVIDDVPQHPQRLGLIEIRRIDCVTVGRGQKFSAIAGGVAKHGSPAVLVARPRRILRAGDHIGIVDAERVRLRVFARPVQDFEHVGLRRPLGRR